MIYSGRERGSQRRMLRSHLFLVALAALSISTATARAQISFSSAIDLALRSDPKIKAAEASVDKARAEVKATRDAFIPSASASGGYGTSTGVPLSVPVVFSLSSQSLLFNFSQKDNVRAATLGLQAATLALQESRDVVAEDVVVTYINLNNLQLKHTAMTEDSGFANRLVEIVQDRLNAGQDSRIELLRARRTAAQIHLQQLQVEDDIASLTDHIARLVGLPGNRLTPVPGSVPALPEVDMLAGEASDSFGIQSAVASAKSKQQIAFGVARYRFRPQVSFGANYSRISTNYTNYVDYYPGFKEKSESAASIGLEITIPLYDRGHEDRAQEAAAEARHAMFDAEDQRNQFLEGRSKLQHGASELAARSTLAEIDLELAQEQLDSVLVQLRANGGSSSGPQMTPKDEQNARLQVGTRRIDLLDAQFRVDQARIGLLRQTGQLDTWINSVEAPSGLITPTVEIK